MNKIDLKILSLLQENANLPVSEIAEAVGLSTTPCWRRIQILEKNGVIKKRVALLDRKQLNLDVMVVVGVRTNQHAPEWFETFSEVVNNIPEVIEFHRMSGELDYLLRVVVPNINAFDAIYKKLIAVGGLLDVSSSFVMEEIKYTTLLPLNYA